MSERAKTAGASSADRTAPSAITVEINDSQAHLPIDQRALVQLVQTVLTQENRSRASISIVLVENATIHDLNRVHLGHDWPTDVISFPLSDADDPELSGELVISTEMARETAAALGADPQEELALYVVHGLLHLCGYDDQDEETAQAMRHREAELLGVLGCSAAFNHGRSD
jgi:probable rRNA maturation factor